MSKAIKSTDPRKPAIVAALKAASGGTKVTNVQEYGPGLYRGDCLRFAGGRYENMGTREVALGMSKVPKEEEKK